MQTNPASPFKSPQNTCMQTQTPWQLVQKKGGFRIDRQHDWQVSRDASLFWLFFSSLHSPEHYRDWSITSEPIFYWQQPECEENPNKCYKENADFIFQSTFLNKCPFSLQNIFLHSLLCITYFICNLSSSMLQFISSHQNKHSKHGHSKCS